MSTVIDSSGGAAGQDSVRTIIDNAHISVNVSLSDIKVYQQVSLSKYYIVVGTAAKNEVITPVPYPIEFIEAKDFQALSDVSLINVGKLDLESYKVDATFPYVLEFPNDSQFGNPNDEINTYNELLYVNLYDFLASLRISRLVGNKLIYDVTTDGNDLEVSKAKRLDIDQIKSRRLTALVSDIYDDIIRDAAIKYCAQTFTDSKAAAIPTTFESGGVPDNLKNFRTATLPITADEEALLRNAELFFSEQYYHPTLAEEDIREILPITEKLTNETTSRIAEMRANVRVPRVMFGRLIYDGMCRWPAIVKDMQRALRQATTFSLVTNNVAEISQIFAKTVRASQTSDKKGTEYVSYLNFVGIPELVKVLYMCYGNPNLMVMRMGVTVAGYTYGDMYLMIVHLLLQILLVPSTLTAEDRISMNNAIAHFIVFCKLTKNTISDINFPTMVSHAWKREGVDYLSRLYQLHYTRLVHSGDAAERGVANFLDEYFNHVIPSAIANTVPFTRSNGMVDQHPLSIIVPYFRGGDSYSYPTMNDNAVLRERICGQNVGVIMPTDFDERLEPSMLRIRSRMNALRHLISDFNSEPVRYPKRNERLEILALVERYTVASLTQFYCKYYALAFKYSLSMYSDPIVRQQIPNWLLQEHNINSSTLLSLFVNLEIMERVETVDKPTFFEGMTSASLAAVFIYAYKAISSLSTILRNDNRVANINLSKRTRIEMAEKLTRDLMGLSDFTISGTLLLADADKVDFDDLIATLLPTDNLRTIKLIAQAQQAMLPLVRSIRERSGFVDKVFVVRRALSCVDPYELSNDPIMATTAPYEDSLNIVKVIDGIAQFNEYVRIPPTTFSRVIKDPDYKADFYSLNEVNSYQLVRKRDCKIDAIQVNLPCKIVIDHHICNSPCIRPSFRGARYEDLIKAYEGTIVGVTDVTLFKIPICVLFNNISSDLTGTTFSVNNIISAFAGVADAEVVVSREQLINSGLFKCIPVLEYLQSLGRNVTYRTQKYEIINDLKITTISCNEIE